MSRIGIADVQHAWRRYCDAAKAVGFDTEGYTMQEGSSTMGVHFSAHTKDGYPVPGALSEGFNSRYLGTNRSETYYALRHMTAVLQAVFYLHNPE